MMSDTKNRDVLLRDPTPAIPNRGVAKVIGPKTSDEWDVLGYELREFVCDGEYEAGLDRILAAFIENLPQPEQPAVWVSGFFGSGKSHLVRVLQFLWHDVEFPDGVSARSLTNLTPDVRAHLKELSRLGAQEGGLWAAAGTLSAGIDSIRLALFAILSRSAGLPAQYPPAQLAMWLKQEGWYDAIEAAIASRGKNLIDELQNMWVSPALAEAVLDVVPGFADSPANVRASFRAQYPPVTDISDDELWSAMHDVLALMSTRTDKLPLALLVLDELQQFIADDPIRALHVQNIVEGCASRFGGHVLLVATGQSDLGAMPQLSKLQGRFSVAVHLSDLDVEKVVRQVALRKSPDRVGELQDVLDEASGEINRHLAGTQIGPRPGDEQHLVADYPLLPVRRRLWERVLRAVDSGGAAGQLRTQLRAVHDATREVADKPLGNVVGGDVLYWQLETVMQNSGILQRDTAARIRKMKDDPADGEFRSRLCALVFLIDQLPVEGPYATEVKATAESLADLLVDDIATGSASLRQRVAAVLPDLVDGGPLMLLGNEYHIQTEEGSEWEAAYRARYAQISADESRLASERGTVLGGAVAEALRGITLAHGATKMARKFDQHFALNAPSAKSGSIPVWVRHEWSVSERTVREDAQTAGIEDPTVFVFLPRLEPAALKKALARFAAAKETIDNSPAPETGGGIQARASMESRAQLEKGRVSALASDIVKKARVYQGGGHELAGEQFDEAVRQALGASLPRMFTRFTSADTLGWDTVVERASQGAADSLTAIGYTGDVDEHAGCREVRTHIGGGGRRGQEARGHFIAPPYGWRQDAVDGALLALLAAGFVRATYNGKPVQAKGLTRQRIGASEFFSEGVTVDAQQRIDLRLLATTMDVPAVAGEETDAAPQILTRLANLAKTAGGEPPLPERPDLTPVIRLQSLAGNAQLVALHEERDQLAAYYNDWSGIVAKKDQREPEWDELTKLLGYAGPLPVSGNVGVQVEAIRRQRSLLDDPNPLTPFLIDLRSALRSTVAAAHQRLETARDAAFQQLTASEAWSRLGADDQQQLLRAYLPPVEELDVSTDDTLLASLGSRSLEDWANRTDAVPTRAEQAIEEAARLLEPEAVRLAPPSAILRTPADVDSYISGFRTTLLGKIEAGTPVVIT